MSDDRDLAMAIYRDIITVERVEYALEIWRDPLHTITWSEADRMKWLLGHVSSAAIEAVLARRQREAARTGPWDEDVTIARLTQERDEARRSAEWLRRIVQWCSKRLRHQSYADTLAKTLSAGVTDVPDDEPAIVVARTGLLP